MNTWEIKWIMVLFGPARILRAHTLSEVALNYTKLTTFSMKAYSGKSKINSAKTLPLVGIESSTSCDLFWCPVCCANQAFCFMYHYLFFGLGSFLESIEHDFMKVLTIYTENQMSSYHSQKGIRVDHKKNSGPGYHPQQRQCFTELVLLFDS